MLDPCTPFCITAGVDHNIIIDLCQPDDDCCCPGISFAVTQISCLPLPAIGYSLTLDITNGTSNTLTGLHLARAAGVLPVGTGTGTPSPANQTFSGGLPPGASISVPLTVNLLPPPEGGKACFDVTLLGPPIGGVPSELCTTRVCAHFPPCPCLSILSENSTCIDGMTEYSVIVRNDSAVLLNYFRLDFDGYGSPAVTRTPTGPIAPGGSVTLTVNVPATSPDFGSICFSLVTGTPAATFCSIRHCIATGCPVFPPPDIPNSCPCDGKWHLTSYRNPNSGPITSITQAIALITAAGTVNVGTSSEKVLNHWDPVTGACPPEKFCHKLTIPGDQPGDTNRFVVTAKSCIKVAAGNAGIWTFRIRADDGIAFRLIDKATNLPMPWMWVTGEGNKLEPGNIGVYHSGVTCNTDCHAGIYLSQGEYCAEFVCYENDGGASFEVYAAKGAYYIGPAGADKWRLVGYKVGQSRWPCMQGDWQVTTSPRGGDGLFNLTQADMETGFGPSQPFPMLNFVDPDAPGSSSIGGDSAFPGNVAGDDNDFVFKASGMLRIPAAGYYLIGFQGDDGTRVTIDTDTQAHAYLALKEDATGFSTGQNYFASSQNHAEIQYDGLSGNNRTVGWFYLHAG